MDQLASSSLKMARQCLRNTPHRGRSNTVQLQTVQDTKPQAARNVESELRHWSKSFPGMVIWGRHRFAVLLMLRKLAIEHLLLARFMFQVQNQGGVLTCCHVPKYG